MQFYRHIIIIIIIITVIVIVRIIFTIVIIVDDVISTMHCRPGRLDKILYVPLPPPEGRGAILQALTRKTPLAVDVDVGAVGASPHCHGFSGADLAALVREACICALKVCPWNRKCIRKDSLRVILGFSLNLIRSPVLYRAAQVGMPLHSSSVAACANQCRQAQEHPA